MNANYSIYQLNKNSKNYRDKSFASLRMLKHFGLTVDFSDYNCVWNDTEDFSSDNDMVICENIFTRFNIGEKPKGYKGHSLSVSDLVMINDNLYFCDSFGFVKIDK